MNHKPVTSVRPPRLVILVWAICFGVSLDAQGDLITVNTEADSLLLDGECSLREAIAAANTDEPKNDCPAGSGSDRIEFAENVTTIRLGAPLPTITASLVIAGPSERTVQLDGDSLFRPIEFRTQTPGAFLIVNDLTLIRGSAEWGGAAWIATGESAFFLRVQFLDNRATDSGGAIAIYETNGEPTFLVLVDCLLEGNSAQVRGGAIDSLGEEVSVAIETSTFVANESNGNGGAVHLGYGSHRITRSTFSGNGSLHSGGAVLASTYLESLTLDIRDSTFTGNGAGLGGAGHGGALRLEGAVRLSLSNSAFSKNLSIHAPLLASPNLSCHEDLQLSSSGPNFIDTNNGCASFLPDGNPNGQGHYVGTPDKPLNALLGALEYLGGPTPVHAPTPHLMSPLIDSGRCPWSEADQRGFGNGAAGVRSIDHPAIPNPVGGDGCDIGSVEIGATPIDLIFDDGFEDGTLAHWD